MRSSESREQTLWRQELDRTQRVNKRKRSMLVEDAIAAFHSEIKFDPCNKVLMYFKKCLVLIFHTLALVVKSGSVGPVIDR